MRLAYFHQRSPQSNLRTKTKCLVPQSQELDDKNVIASDHHSHVGSPTQLCWLIPKESHRRGHAIGPFWVAHPMRSVNR
jgi:hypothetical protein